MSRWLRAAGVSTEVQKGQFRQKGQNPPIGTETRLLSPSVPFVPFVLTSKGLTPDQLDAIEERAAIIEFDAYYSRREAERRALNEQLNGGNAA